ncbi:MAG: hypothetical protein JNM79_01660 [Burkholderiales bacterium]|nr:hypothetical protein [Burkholderiales bacterium]
MRALIRRIVVALSARRVAEDKRRLEGILRGFGLSRAQARAAVSEYFGVPPRAGR